jgi:hypothetical protein
MINKETTVTTIPYSIPPGNTGDDVVFPKRDREKGDRLAPNTFFLGR